METTKLQYACVWKAGGNPVDDMQYNTRKESHN